MSGWYEALFRGVLYPLYETGLRRRSTLRYLRQYEASQWQSRDRIEQSQWAKLAPLLAHCWSEVPFYRDAWSRAGFKPNDIRSIADFRRLPILEKADIRANLDDLVAGSHRGKVIYKSTGGSTGEPLRFGYSRESYERRMAVMWRGYRWAGADIGRRTLYLWGASGGAQGAWSRAKERAYHAAFGRRMLDAFSIGEGGFERYAAVIERYRPQVIVAYVNPIWQLARWINANRRGAWRPRAIITGAESLFAGQRADIESAFGCKVFNTYGCREFMLIASECEAKLGLHVNADNLVVETATDTPIAGSDGAGDVLVTDLHNYAMPFIRYRNGDRAFLSSDACSCGRGLPLLRSVEGRILDALRTRDGRYLPGEFFPHRLKDVRGIKHFQVVQRALDRIELRIVREPDLREADIEGVRADVMRAMGQGTDLQVVYVDSIPPTASGKRRVTVSEIGG